MKIFITVLLVLSTCYTVTCQEKIEHFSTIDQTINTLYQVISGDKGELRDWDLFNSIFHEDAQMLPIGPSREGGISVRYITPAEYIDKSGDYLVEVGFHEVEINRIVETFGHLAHVFSTYEAYNHEFDDAPFMRGINSIQLFNDGNRWWVTNISWTQESDDNPLSKKYLPK